jgi:hypothetical protein
MVEAAGVEPASEKARREKPTCVSGSVVVGRQHKSRQERGGLARLGLGFTAPSRSCFSPACEMTSDGCCASPTSGTAT